MTAPSGGVLEGGFSRRVLGWVVAVAVASFLAAVLLSAFGDDLSTWPSAGADSFSYSAIGHHALAELLSSLGLGVVSRQSRSPAGLGPGTPLVLAEPDLDRLEGIAARSAEALRARAPVVVVLPKWDGAPLPRHPGWIRAAALRHPHEVGRVLAAVGVLPTAVAIERGRLARPGARCTVSGPGEALHVTLDLAPAQTLREIQRSPSFQPIVACGPDLVVVARYDTGDPSDPGLYVVADPDLLNNQGLARGDHAALVHHLFVTRLRARGVVFDETVHGFLRSESLLAEAFRFPLLPATLQGIVLLAVILWAGMARFGKPLAAAPALAPGKEVLIDNTAALLTHGGHAADSLARYYRQTLRAAAAASYLPPELSEEALRRRLQELARQRGVGADLDRLHRQVERLAGERRAAREAVGVAARLHRWRLEMTHGHRADP